MYVVLHFKDNNNVSVQLQVTMNHEPNWNDFKINAYHGHFAIVKKVKKYDRFYQVWSFFLGKMLIFSIGSFYCCRKRELSLQL